MLSKKQWTVVSGVAATSLVTGVAAGYLSMGQSLSTNSANSTPHPTATSENSPPRVPLSAIGKNKAQDGSSRRGTNAFRRASAENAGSTNARMRAYLRIILDADEGELPQLMLDALREFDADSLFARTLFPIIAERWVEADPAGAFREFYAGKLVSSFVPNDDPFASYSGQPHPTFTIVLKKALERDPQSVRESLIDKPSQPNADQVTQAIARMDSRTDVTGAFEFIDGLADLYLRDEAIGAILDPSHEDYRPLTIDETRTLLNHYPDFALGSAHFANADTRSALAYAEEFPLGERRSAAVSHVLRQWAAADFESALAYVKSAPSALEQGQLYLAVYREHLKRDPAEAANAVLQIPKRRLRNSLLPDAARKWFADEPGAALEWMDTSLAPEVWEKAAEEILTDRRGTGERAVLAARLPADHDAVASFLQIWIREDSQAVDNWIATRPPGDRPILKNHLVKEKDNPFE